MKTKRIKFLIIFTVILLTQSIFCTGQQNFPNATIKMINQIAGNNSVKYSANTSETAINTSIGECLIRQQKSLENLRSDINISKSSDTLFIGITPGDSLYITGDYNYNGTIFILNGGKLVFDSSNAVINGDLIVYGEDSKVWILNSTLHFPQLFIYQRSLISVANAEVFVNNSTFDYYGLPHDLVIAQNARVLWDNVTNIGFTTCGLSGGSSIEVNGTNQAGEYIMTEDVEASFTDAATVLIWHHIGNEAVFDFSFPEGSLIESFDFNGYQAGITEVNYSYHFENCSEVMWGLMPEAYSDVTISDSQIRTIGVWFNNLPVYNVSGLVNNSHYTDFEAPLSEHNIHLINSDVQTWSLYMFHGSEGNVSNCIVGEIGTMGNSTCTAQNCMIDGSGGYLFATDTTVLTSAFSYLNCNFQTSGIAFGIMAYGAQNNGKCIAFEKSVMILVQANLIQQPVYYDDAMMWYLFLEGPEEGQTNSQIPIIGSAWIEKASDYYPIDFGWYTIDYQPVDSGQWLSVCDTVYNEVFSDELCVWNTVGLIPGYYNIKITMCDNTIDNNKIEAVRQVVLTDVAVSSKENDINRTTIYPNPVSKDQSITISGNGNKIDYVEIYDFTGKIVIKYIIEKSLENISFYPNLQHPGIYLVNIYNKNSGLIAEKKLIIL